MTDKQELKPCPHIHSEGRGKQPPYVVGPTLKYYWSARVECSCGAAGPWMNTEAEAIAAWNARPADLTGELVEALRYLSVTADHHRAAAAIAYNAVMGRSRSADDAIYEEIESRSVLEAAQRVAQAVLAKVKP